MTSPDQDPRVWERTVDAQLGVADNLPDGALLLEIVEGLSGERAVDLQTIDEGGNGDEAVGLDILVELVRGLLVENDGVLGLVLNCGTR
jgi:hypothetical protein